MNVQDNYDDWLKHEIEASISDERPAVPLTELEKTWAKERAELLEQARKVA